MTAALRLVRDHGFDVLGVQAIRWQAAVGNWGSRRTAAAAGFRFDGTIRWLLSHRGELLDGWHATLTADDPRVDLSWPSPPMLAGGRITLRPFATADAGRDGRGLRRRRDGLLAGLAAAAVRIRVTPGAPGGRPGDGGPPAPAGPGAWPTPRTAASGGQPGGLRRLRATAGDRLLGPPGRPRPVVWSRKRSGWSRGCRGSRRAGRLGDHPLRRREPWRPDGWPRRPATSATGSSRPASHWATARWTISSSIPEEM